MSSSKKLLESKKKRAIPVLTGYTSVHKNIVALLQSARQAAARTVNALITTTYWEIGRRIVEFEQGGSDRAAYGEVLIQRLANDLSNQFGRGFSKRNLEHMRLFYQCWPITQTASAQLVDMPAGHICQTVSGKLDAPQFPLPWSAYVRLLSVKNSQARQFYEAEALRAGWSVRQLDRQINSQFYDRTALSRNKAALLRKAETALPEDCITAEEAIKDPYVLEFLDLKDEYSETELEAALIHRLEEFLFELGDDFAFVGRQRRLRIGDEWYRVDLLFFHRRLKALVVIDLKIGKFTHADAGQMHLYLNYARKHWVCEGENPPIGLILCAQKDSAVARYALEGLPNKVLAAEYRILLPDAELIAKELDKAKRAMEMKKKSANTNKKRVSKSRKRK